MLYWYADRIVMGMVGARELLPGEAPALHAAVERSRRGRGVVKPRALRAPRRLPARAVGRPRRAGGSALAVSTGLLGVATPAELEGIVAHELAHLRNRDVLVQTIVVVLAGGARRGVSRSAATSSGRSCSCSAPLAASFVHLLLSPKREFEADRFAAELCESPHGLADALLRLEQAMELVEFQASPATEPLYTIEPVRRRGPRARSSSRTRRSASACGGCATLDPEWREKLRAA